MDVPKMRQMDVPKMRQMDVPKVRQMDVPKVRQMDVPKVRQMDVPKVRQMDVPKVRQMDVPKVRQMDVPKVRQMVARGERSVAPGRFAAVGAPKVRQKSRQSIALSVLGFLFRFSRGIVLASLALPLATIWRAVGAP